MDKIKTWCTKCNAPLAVPKEYYTKEWEKRYWVIRVNMDCPQCHFSNNITMLQKFVITDFVMT